MKDNTVFWKMRNGKLISVDEMDINHLRNTLKMIIKKNNKQVQLCPLCKKPKNSIECCGFDATEIDIY